MALSDTAEYWQDVKSNYPYMGREFYHIPHADCGHRHLNVAKKLGDVNCYSCLKLIKQGYEHGLEDGKTDFRSKGQRKRDNQAERIKAENERLGKCKCGCQRVQRFNSIKKTFFLGCSNYPKCNITYPYSVLQQLTLNT